MPKPLRCDPALFDKDLSGKVVIVTGALGGIGLCTAQQLLKQKATVILAGRNAAEGERLAGETGGVFLQLDLSSLQSVRNFAAAFLAKYDRLDILVNNAGVMCPPLTHTKDDFELQMGTNHFGHFLLTELLKEVLELSAPSRVVALSSCASAKCSPAIGTDCKIDFADLHWKARKYNKGEAYAQSKLANVLHAMEIPRRYKGVAAYSVHPGVVQTNLFRHFPIPGCCKPCLSCCVMKLGVMIPVWEGTQSSLHCILSEPEALESGAFFSQFHSGYVEKRCRPGGWPLKHPNPEASLANAARLWEESRVLVGLEAGAVIGAQATEVKAPCQQQLVEISGG